MKNSYQYSKQVLAQQNLIIGNSKNLIVQFDVFHQMLKSNFSKFL